MTDSAEELRRRQILEEGRARAAGRPVPSPAVRRTEGVADLIFKERENSLVSTPEATPQISGDETVVSWDALEPYLQEFLGEIVKRLGDEIDGLRDEFRKADRDAEAERLRENARIWGSVTEALRHVTELRQERVDRAFRELPVDKVKVN